MLQENIKVLYCEEGCCLVLNEKCSRFVVLQESGMENGKRKLIVGDGVVLNKKCSRRVV